jgi:hypothetical protein
MLPTNHEIMERRFAQGATDALAAREAQEARDAARLALWPELVNLLHRMKERDLPCGCHFGNPPCVTCLSLALLAKAKGLE